MNVLTTMLRELADRWQMMPPLRRAMVAGVTVITLVAVVLSANMATSTEYAVAYSGLRDEDAAAIVAKLKESKIPYQIPEPGTIQVPRTQVQDVKLLASSLNLTQKGNGVGFELFNQPHFGLTEFAEKVNYQRALEGELSRTISRLDAVESTRVHLVVPQPSLFSATQKETTASVILQIKAGRRLDAAQVQGIGQLIASSVEGLKPTNISVMDTQGNVLTERDGGMTDPSRASDRRKTMQRSLETRLEDDITVMLARVLGPRRAIVHVGADLDWDQYEANIETYSPQDKQPQVRTSRESLETSAGNSGASGGFAGDANLPTYASTDSRGNASQAEKRDTTRTYELSKTVERINRAPGAIKRLSVAVALDSEIAGDPAQVDAISKLIATAAGVDVARGDLVTLTTLPFVSEAEPNTETLASARQVEMFLTIGKVAAMVLGPILLLLLFRQILPRPRSVALLATAGGQMLVSSGVQSENDVKRLREPSREDLEAVRLKQEISDYSQSDPAAVAQIVRTWLKEDHNRR